MKISLVATFLRIKTIKIFRIFILIKTVYATYKTSIISRFFKTSVQCNGTYRQTLSVFLNKSSV